MTDKITQRAEVLNWLQTHDGLTVREAVTELNIMSLPKRIEELRKAKYNISTTYRKSNTGKRVGVYVLQKGEADDL